jgi:hypothetical protein
MTVKRLLVTAGLFGVAGLAAGCKDQPVRDYLSETGEMRAWEVRIETAICQLEQNNPGGLDAGKRICPSGPGSETPPPKYPPK